MNLKLDDVQKLAAIFAAVATPILAYVGFLKWRAELRGKTNYETARKLLRAALLLKDELRMARNPFMANAEWEGRTPLDNEKEKDRHANEVMYAYYKRMMKVFEVNREFHLARLDAQVLWPERLTSYCEALEKCVGELNVSLTAYGMYRRSDLPHNESIKKAEAVIYAGMQDDPFDKKVNAALYELEAFLRPHIGD